MMIEKPKKKKKGLISEQDISTILQRYSANTVLALLQEVGAQNPGVKIDWNALVKKSSTGISNAREYQMLWRHLAYRYSLLDKSEDGALPLDDDSDLEFELEAFPDVSSEAATEAAACVKVLIASGLPRDSSLPNSSTVEAPLTINIPNGHSFRAPLENSESCLMQGVNITVPVSVQKQPLPAVTSSEVLENGSASGSMPIRKKRKPWSHEEDRELIAAVEKCGEGNWANILRGDFKGVRTASQLSQRWAILRKRNVDFNFGGPGSRFSEVQEATRHAMSLALNLPLKTRMETCTNSPAVGATFNSTSSNSVIPTTTAEASLVDSSTGQGKNQTQILKKSSSMGQLGSTEKSRVTSKKSLAKSNLNSDLMVRATAVAAGARIATPSDAALLLKAAQSKNAVHFKSSSSCGLAAASLSTYPAAASGASCPGSVKAASSTVQQHATSTSAMSPEQTTAVTSSRVIQLPPNQEVTTAEESKVSVSGNEPKEQVHEEGACLSGDNATEEIREYKAPSPNPDAEVKNQVPIAENPISVLNMEKFESDQAEVIDNQADESQIAKDDEMVSSPVKESDIQAAVEENCGNQSANEKQEDLPSMVTDGCSENMEVSSKAEAANEI